MSCSHLIDTYTNARYIYRGVSRFKQSFLCGKCSSCISKQRTDWRVRTYYESVDCLRKKSNFVLFDTLTYCDDYVKRYSDVFPDMQIPALLDEYCFSRDDVQKFFKRLRINLRRAGYRFFPRALRYILASEYGTSEETYGFKNTHRPHYHILFYVSFPISPIEFSRYVARSWYLGKTDGVRPYDDCKECPVRSYCRGKCLYHSSDYVLNERLVNNDTSSNLVKCVNYVTKYISKDMYMSGQLQNNVDILWNYLYPEWRDDIQLYRRYRVFCSQVLPFHLQSQSFGIALLSDKSELDYAVRTNKVHLPTGRRDVIRSVALPRYYQRKLYYDFVKDKEDGRVRWFLTPFGVETKVAQLDGRIRSFMADYRSYDVDITNDSLYDLALYNCVYRGTLSDYQSLMLPYRQYYRKMIQPHGVDERPLYYNYRTHRDRLTVGVFLSPSYYVTSDGEIVFKGKQSHKEFIPFDGYVVVDDKVCPYWNGFDRKLSAYQHWRAQNAESRDILVAHADEMVDYHRQIGLLPP